MLFSPAPADCIRLSSSDSEEEAAGVAAASGSGVAQDMLISPAAPAARQQGQPSKLASPRRSGQGGKSASPRPRGRPCKVQQASADEAIPRSSPATLTPWRRGRPRKTNFGVAANETAPRRSSEPGASAAASGPGEPAPATLRPRGRPPGSRNRSRSSSIDEAVPMCSPMPELPMQRAVSPQKHSHSSNGAGSSRRGGGGLTRASEDGARSPESLSRASPSGAGGGVTPEPACVSPPMASPPGSDSPCSGWDTGGYNDDPVAVLAAPLCDAAAPEHQCISLLSPD